MIYCTNQPQIVKHAEYCYNTYPTIVNNIPKEKNHYDNTLLDRAVVDNTLAKAQRAIGESSNLAQIALTYTYNFDDKKYKDYVCVLSVVAQCAIDNAKRKYDIDLPKEIRRIKKDLDIKDNGYPLFWKYIEKGDKVNHKLDCPMNYLCKLKFAEFKIRDSVLPMSCFFNKYELKETRRKSKRVESLIEKYSLKLSDYVRKPYVENDKIVLIDDFDNLLNDIQRVYISHDYIGLMSWLIDRAFCIIPQTKGKYEITNSVTEQNKSILLKVLYTINSENVLEIFSKNA